VGQPIAPGKGTVPAPGSGPSPDLWAIDVPAVLAMLQAVTDGQATAEDVSEAILVLIAMAPAARVAAYGHRCEVDVAARRGVRW
jgi:hypothetical protein